jgi:hypothetical protein
MICCSCGTQFWLLSDYTGADGLYCSSWCYIMGIKIDWDEPNRTGSSVHIQGGDYDLFPEAPRRTSDKGRGTMP